MCRIQHWLQNSSSGVDEPVIHLRIMCHPIVSNIQQQVNGFIVIPAGALILSGWPAVSFLLPLGRDALNVETTKTLEQQLPFEVGLLS